MHHTFSLRSMHIDGFVRGTPTRLSDVEAGSPSNAVGYLAVPVDPAVAPAKLGGATKLGMLASRGKGRQAPRGARGGEEKD